MAQTHLVRRMLETLDPDPLVLHVSSLLQAIQDLIAAENRYKDGCSDERYTDHEIATRKRVARDAAIDVTKVLGFDVLNTAQPIMSVDDQVALRLHCSEVL